MRIKCRNKEDLCRSWLEQLPPDLLCKIFDYCDPESFRSLQRCSRVLNLMAKESIPSIKTELCAHQRKSLKWMAWREQPGKKMENICCRCIQTEWGPLEIDEVRGTLACRDKEDLDDIRGGILADEPGLGKTVTILSLVMRTRGVLPAPPENSTAFIEPGCNGHDVGWYKIEERSELSGSTSSSRELRARYKDPVTQRVTALSPSVHRSPAVVCQGGEVNPRKARRIVTSDDGGAGPSASTSAAPTALPSTPQNYHVAQSGDDMDWSVDGRSATPLVGSSDADAFSVMEDDETLTPEVSVDNWIQCEICYTWKPIPDHYQVEPGRRWTCGHHPDSSKRRCAVPNEKEYPANATVLRESGYINAGDIHFTEDNVRHFSQILERCSRILEIPGNPIVSLCRLKRSQLHNGFTVPPDSRIQAYDIVFKRLGFERLTRKKRSLDCIDSTETHRWKIPATHKHLDLDTRALEAALIPLTNQLQRRMLLSPATLIVVPFPLIEQWEQEISKHFRGNHIRVCVITKKSEYPRHICQLAWGYDVVLTTFSHLSNSVSNQLLRIHWLRVVLDEGHLIGVTLVSTSRKERINALQAERRWIITGTPTPDLAHQSTVSHLYPLIQFLKIEPFARVKKLWEDFIRKPFEAGLPEGKRRLLSLLNTFMIRTFKDEIRGLVNVHKKFTCLEFEPAHAASYNELVEVVQRNLLLADFGEEGHRESLLNPGNTKWASEMLRNVHLSCCVAGNCFLQANEMQLMDSLLKLAIRNGYSCDFLAGDPWWVPHHHPLREIESALRDGGVCSSCLDLVRLPLVTPCAHLLCENCVQKDRQRCPTCGNPYVMQSITDPSRLAHNSNPKLPVPIEVIEWQPSYAQAGAIGKSGGGWQHDWRATQSSKCKHLVERLREIGITDDDDDVKKRPKAIVFSRFWPHINLIDQSLSDANIAHCTLKRDIRARDKNTVVDVFRSNSDFGVLLMDTTGAVGLDLSMASWVFLMEPLLDRSVEEQIVSRAHRMGAMKDVHVEVLLMKGSVEELTMNRFISTKEKAEATTSSSEMTEDNRTIRNTLISGLERVRSSSTEQDAS